MIPGKPEGYRIARLSPYPAHGSGFVLVAELEPIPEPELCGEPDCSGYCAYILHLEARLAALEADYNYCLNAQIANDQETALALARRERDEARARVAELEQAYRAQGEAYIAMEDMYKSRNAELERVREAAEAVYRERHAFGEVPWAEVIERLGEALRLLENRELD